MSDSFIYRYWVVTGREFSPLNPDAEEVTTVSEVKIEFDPLARIDKMWAELARYAELADRIRQETGYDGDSFDLIEQAVEER